MTTEASTAKLEAIEKLIEDKDYAHAESDLKQILSKAYETDGELREHEKALLLLGSLYKTQK